MRRLTALALLVSALFITPLYGEETTPICRRWISLRQSRARRLHRRRSFRR